MEYTYTCILIHVRVCLQTLCPSKHTAFNQEEKKQHYHFFFIKETPEESRPIWSMHNITVLTKSTVFLLFVSISVSSTKLSHLPLQSSGSSGKQRSPKRLPQLREKGSKPVTHKSAGELSDALCKCKPKTQHHMGCYEDSQLHPSQTQHSKTVERNNNDL